MFNRNLSRKYSLTFYVFGFRYVRKCDNLWDDRKRPTKLCLYQWNLCLGSLFCFMTWLDFDMLLFGTIRRHSDIWKCKTIFEFSFVNVGLDIIGIKTHVNLTYLHRLFLIKSKSWLICLQRVVFFIWWVNPLLLHLLHYWWLLSNKILYFHPKFEGIL